MLSYPLSFSSFFPSTLLVCKREHGSAEGHACPAMRSRLFFAQTWSGSQLCSPEPLVPPAEKRSQRWGAGSFCLSGAERAYPPCCRAVLKYRTAKAALPRGQHAQTLGKKIFFPVRGVREWGSQIQPGSLRYLSHPGPRAPLPPSWETGLAHASLGRASEGQTDGRMEEGGMEEGGRQQEAGLREEV